MKIGGRVVFRFAGLNAEGVIEKIMPNDKLGIRGDDGYYHPVKKDEVVSVLKNSDTEFVCNYKLEYDDLLTNEEKVPKNGCNCHCGGCNSIIDSHNNIINTNNNKDYD
jgi:hypothetical protein